MKNKIIKVIFVCFSALILINTKLGFATNIPCSFKVHQGESIQAAIDQANLPYAPTGCTIWIAAGIYNEDLVIGGFNPRIRDLKLIGAAMNQTVIRGSIDISSTDEHGAPISTGLTMIKNLTLDGAGASSSGLLIRFGATAFLESVRIYNFYGAGVWLVDSENGVTLSQCVIDHNYIGIGMGRQETLFLLNSTIAYNTDAGVRVSNPLYLRSSFGKLINNIFYGNGTGVFVHYAQAFIEYNDFFGNTEDIHEGLPPFEGWPVITGDPSTNLHADPRFVDPNAGNYHLRRNSPAINAGDPVSPRDPDGTRSDMGALPYYLSRNRVPVPAVATPLPVPEP